MKIMTWVEVMKVAQTVAAARGVRYRVVGRRDRAGWYYVAEPTR